jgi:hypothetical protein
MQSLDLGTNAEENLEKLPQDFGRPFSQPYDTLGDVPLDHPSLDIDADAQEWYDEGRDGVSGMRDFEERELAEEAVIR